MKALWIVLAFAVGWSLGRVTTEASVLRRIRQLRRSVEIAERELDALCRERGN